MLKRLIIFFSNFFIFFVFNFFACDLNIVGILDQTDGLGRIPIGIIDTLGKDANIHFIAINGHVNLKDVSNRVKKIVLSSQSVSSIASKNISLYTFLPVWDSPFLFQFMPDSLIKIAYSMFETTRIPQEWVNAFNTFVDAVVVPDPYLIEVYENSGVNVPIFFLPLGMYLDDFFKIKKSKKPCKPFIFGCTATFIPRKNLHLLIQAFREEFGESDDVQLCIHGRYQVDLIMNSRTIGNLNNVILCQKCLSHQEYVKLMNSFDCYVNLSKGEGFSCGPREALALGIPCILSNNTAHQTLCKSGFIRAVSSNIKEKGSCLNSLCNQSDLGYQFDCHLEDVRIALRDVYQNYQKYYKLAQLGKNWVKKYSWPNLKEKYFNLLKPKKIIQGTENKITKNYLMTNSEILFNKYKSLRYKTNTHRHGNMNYSL